MENNSEILLHLIAPLLCSSRYTSGLCRIGGVAMAFMILVYVVSLLLNMFYVTPLL